jgi:glucose 1-dehydrogenase
LASGPRAARKLEPRGQNFAASRTPAEEGEPVKAITMHPARREIALTDIAPPKKLDAGHVRVRTLELGLCGTDKEIAAFELGTPPEGDDYLVVGHECLGEIVEVGPGVDGLAVGDLVVPQVRRPCARTECGPCRAGRSDYCITGEFKERGIKDLHGFGSEEWVDEARYLHRADTSLRQVAVLTEPLTIAEKALSTVATVQARLPSGPGSPGKALVIGSGAVGQLGALALRRAGYRVHVYARSPAKDNPKAAAAERIGAGYLSSEQVPVSALTDTIGGFELVYEAAGAASLAFEVLTALAPNGVFIVTGVPGRKQVLDLDGAALMKSVVLNNQLVVGTVNAGPDAFEAALRDLARCEARWPNAANALITHRHAPEQAPEVLGAGVPGGIKHVVEFARGP